MTAVRKQPPSIKPRTPVPSPQSQSFSRGYGSVLPTSLIYIALSTRGCAPWRPDAVMSTTGGENNATSTGFSRAVESARGRHKSCAAFPPSGPYRRTSRFQGSPKGVNEKRQLSPGLSPTSPVALVSPLSIHVPVRES